MMFWLHHCSIILNRNSLNLIFVRVDADVVEKLIAKDDLDQPMLTTDEKNELSPIFQSVIPKERGQFIIDFQNLGETGSQW